MKTYIHINRQTIDSNRKNGLDRPPVRIQHGKTGQPTYANEVEIQGPCRVIYSAHKPLLKCGARLVIVTESPVKAT